MTITIALSGIVLQEEDDEGEEEEGGGCFQSKCPGDSPVVVVDEMHEEVERDACPQQSSPLVNRFFA